MYTLIHTHKLSLTHTLTHTHTRKHTTLTGPTWAQMLVEAGGKDLLMLTTNNGWSCLYVAAVKGRDGMGKVRQGMCRQIGNEACDPHSLAAPHTHTCRILISTHPHTQTHTHTTHTHAHTHTHAQTQTYMHTKHSQGLHGRRCWWRPAAKTCSCSPTTTAGAASTLQPRWGMMAWAR